MLRDVWKQLRCEAGELKSELSERFDRVVAAYRTEASCNRTCVSLLEDAFASAHSLDWIGDDMGDVDEGYPGHPLMGLRHFINCRRNISENLARVRQIDPDIADAAEVIVSQHLAHAAIAIRLYRRRNKYWCLRSQFQFDGADGEPEASKGDFEKMEALVGKGESRVDERELLQRASVVDGKPFLYSEQLFPPMR